MKQTWINYIQHVTIFISHIVTILVYVHTHIYLLWCVCPASNGNHQIFVVVDPYCTFPTPLRDTTHLWTIGGCTGCVSLRVSVLEEDRVFGFSPRDYWCQGDLKHMLYDCHVSNIANSSGIFSVDEVWRSIRIIQLLTWSDLRYNKFVGSNQRGGSNDDCYILFCNCQLGSPLILSAAKDEKCQSGEPKKGFLSGSCEDHGPQLLPWASGVVHVYHIHYVIQEAQVHVRIYIYIYLHVHVYTCTHSAIQIRWYKIDSADYGFLMILVEIVKLEVTAFCVLANIVGLVSRLAFPKTSPHVINAAIGSTRCQSSARMEFKGLCDASAPETVGLPQEGFKKLRWCGGNARIDRIDNI